MKGKNWKTKSREKQTYFVSSEIVTILAAALFSTIFPFGKACTIEL